MKMEPQKAASTPVSNERSMKGEGICNRDIFIYASFYMRSISHSLINLK